MNTLLIEIGDTKLDVPEELLAQITPVIEGLFQNYITESFLITREIIAEIALITLAVDNQFGREKTKRMYGRLYAAIKHELFVNSWRIRRMYTDDDHIIKPCGCFYTMAYFHTRQDSTDLGPELDDASALYDTFVAPYRFNNPVKINDCFVEYDSSDNNLVELLIGRGDSSSFKLIFSPILNFLAKELNLFQSAAEIAGYADAMYSEMLQYIVRNNVGY